MKLQVTQQNLAKALNTVARVASARNTLPILANVLLKTTNNRLSISATNLDIAITQTVGSKVDKDGSITVPAKLTQDFVNNLPDSVIELNSTENKLSISTEKYQSVINGVSADDFPAMPEIKSGNVWTVNALDIKKALASVVFSASTDDSRPVLSGVFFHSQNGQIVIAATDSYRLAEFEFKDQKQELNFILPHSAASDILRIFSEDTQQIKVTHDDQQASFSTEDITLVARLIEGNYPDYKKLIPGKFQTTAKVNRAELLNIAKVSSLFARESAGSITIKVDDKKISVSAIASQVGENSAAADAEVKGGGEVTLNSRYLIEALNAFNTEEIEFCFNGKLEPCIVRSSKEPGYLHLVMPLRS